MRKTRNTIPYKLVKVEYAESRNKKQAKYNANKIKKEKNGEVEISKSSKYKSELNSSDEDQVYKCSNCQKQFKRLKNFNRHKEKANCEYASDHKINEKSRSKKFECDRCMESFATKRGLTAHEKDHIFQDFEEKITFRYDELQDLYICELCSAEFQVKAEAEKHIKKHVKTQQCKLCDDSFISSYELGIHSSTHSPESIISCPLCVYTTLNRHSFKKHMDEIHLKKFNYCCPICGKGYNHLLRFEEHVNTHSGVKQSICVVCSHKFVSDRCMLKHQIRKHQVGIVGHTSECIRCNEYFYRPEVLQKHQENCIKKISKELEKKFLCSYCGHGFKRRFELVDHIRMHTGEKPFVCSYCGKGFVKKKLMNIHIRIHTGEKPFSCEYCGRRFTQRMPFVVHKRTHTGERPYVCAFCGKGFITNQSLKFHLKNCGD